MNAIDTNIWLYAHDRRDPVKQQAAQKLIEQLDSIALPWQVGCEFIAAARKLEPFGFTQGHAWAAFQEMRDLSDAIVLPDPADLERCP
jgi:predicted nucleic acid-binding protein